MTHSAPLHRIVSFRLVTRDPERLRRFYVDAVGCWASASAPISREELALLSLRRGGQRITLALGDQRIDLDAFSEPGRPYPNGADAADLIFQHFAIVVSDAASAYRRVLDHGAAAISNDGPIQLPAAQGGVIAVKFRDPEGHPLEFLQFPPGADTLWSREAPRSGGALGIDHSAISVADADASALFYAAHGLQPGARTLNQGETQAALDGLAAPCVDVVPMLPAVAAPHLELLGYRTPRLGPAPLLYANDIAATRILWASDRQALIRDPDGHLHQLERQP